MVTGSAAFDFGLLVSISVCCLGFGGVAAGQVIEASTRAAPVETATRPAPADLSADKEDGLYLTMPLVALRLWPGTVLTRVDVSRLKRGAAGDVSIVDKAGKKLESVADRWGSVLAVTVGDEDVRPFKVAESGQRVTVSTKADDVFATRVRLTCRDKEDVEITVTRQLPGPELRKRLTMDSPFRRYMRFKRFIALRCMTTLGWQKEVISEIGDLLGERLERVSDQALFLEVRGDLKDIQAVKDAGPASRLVGGPASPKAEADRAWKEIVLDCRRMLAQNTPQQGKWDGGDVFAYRLSFDEGQPVESDVVAYHVEGGACVACVVISTPFRLPSLKDRFDEVQRRVA